MKKIAALDSGTQYHLVSLHREPFVKYFSKIPYLPELREGDLDEMDVLWVSCASPADQVLAHKDIFLRFLRQGKTLVVTARNAAEEWLPGVERVPLPFDCWWWLDKEHNSIDLKVTDENHRLFDYIAFDNMNWHFHDGYRLLPGGKGAVAHKTIDDAYIFQDVERYEGGRLILSSLDPLFHHGNFFMPNASRFGAALLKYISE